MLQITIRYGNAVTTLPAISPEVLDRATATDLRLLLRLCSTGASRSAADMDALCTELTTAGGSAVETAASLAFWRGAGVLELSETGVAPAEKPAPTVACTTAPAVPDPSASKSNVTIRTAADQLPRYTSDELSALLEARTETRQSIDECHRLWGRMLNIQEINTLLGLSDYLGLDWDYILSLLARCVSDMDRRGAKHSMRYVEKQALHFYDEEIRTLDALQEKFRALDLLHSTEHRLRTLFGMGDRALSPSEKKYFSAWLYDFGYDFEIIEMAFNITVDKKGKPDKPYMNSILFNWNRDGLRTPEAIEAADAAFRAARELDRAAKGNPPQKNAPTSSSFETDDFFSAAVRRSLGDDFIPDGK